MVLRDQDRTEVIVQVSPFFSNPSQESTAKVAYELDSTQIEFGTALDDLDFARALEFLERIGNDVDTYSMWKRVAALAVEQQKLLIAQRCYAAIGDVARAQELQVSLVETSTA